MHSPGPSPQSQKTRRPSVRSCAGTGGHDLVDALSAEFVPVGDLRHGLTTTPSRQDLRIPLLFPAWAGSKRTPVPPGDHLKATNALRLQFVLPVTATGVVDPVAEPDGLALVHLDVGCRDFAMALAHSKLIECTDVLDEGIFVVHGKQSSHIRWRGQRSSREVPGYAQKSANRTSRLYAQTKTVRPVPYKLRWWKACSKKVLTNSTS